MLEYFLLILGLILLIKSADYLVDGSSALAKKIGVSSLVIGLTIVAFGTSLPELIVSIFGSLSGSSELILGNVIGSNISNTMLILGILGLITTIKVKNSTTWKEIPFSILMSGLVLLFALRTFIDPKTPNELLRTDGIILLTFFGLFLYYIYHLVKIHKHKPELEEIKTYSNAVISVMILGGLVGIYFGGKWTVDSAIIIARSVGISEFLISATIIAIGTSLPELVTSIIAAFKKNVDLALGNIVGSNIFNILWILGVSAVLKPIAFPGYIIFDLVILLISAMLLFTFMLTGEKQRLEKWKAIVFLVVYATYIIFVIFRG